jgi:hypothetical protein
MTDHPDLPGNTSDAARQTGLRRGHGRTMLMALRQVVDGLPGAMLGALVYALWAVYANRAAGPETAITVGAVHWLASTLLTYYGTAIMRRFFRRGRSARQGAVLAFCGGMGCTYAVLWGVHAAIGTPQVVMTLAAGFIPTLLFCLGYALLLARTTLPSTASAHA